MRGAMDTQSSLVSVQLWFILSLVIVIVITAWSVLTTPSITPLQWDADDNIYLRTLKEHLFVRVDFNGPHGSRLILSG